MTSAGARVRPPLTIFSLVLAVIALLLTPFPWVGVAASLLALLVGGLSWRFADVTGGRVGFAQAAIGVALASLAISGIWTAVAATLPRPAAPPPPDCSTPNLPPADRARCADQP